MRITFAFERRRFAGERVVVLPGAEPCEDAAVLIVDVSSPKMIATASEQSAVVKDVFEKLANQGISPLFPGFDVLTIKSDEIDRMIELKSSGVDAQVQAMSWNEWKTAGHADLRARFYLYLVGNLRADIDTAPFIRTICDPFGELLATEQTNRTLRRSVQLDVTAFRQAEFQELVVRATTSSG